jgi:hypothetical protein
LVQTKIYDLGSGTVNKTSNTSYSYNSNYKVSQQSITNSDNTILTTNIQYAKDYNALTHNDSYTTGLYNLQLQNINIPIETYSQVTIGGTTKTTGGSLVLFNSTPGFGGSTNLTLPIRKLSFTDPYGFTGFTTSGISGGYFVNDSHYITNENNLIYDYSGFLLSKDDGFGHQQAAIIDHNSYQPVAVMKNATYDQIAFSDFDSKLSGFTFSGGGSSSTTSRTGALGWSLNSGASLSRLGITNNTKAQNYIFSIWIYGSGSGNVSITDGASTNSASISASGSGWTYHEVHIPVANLSSSLNVSFSATSNSIIDDILCYPDIAEVSTFAYDNTTHFKTAETNTNGVSTYYINDTWGRKLYIYDQDHNIIQRNSYVTISQNFTPTIALSYPQYFNTAISFSIAGYGSCVGSGVTVDWSIDGASMITAAALSYALSHTFTSGSSHTATAIVHIPGVGDKTVTSTFTISTNPNPTVAVTYNTYTFGNGNVSSITFTPTGGGTAITKSNAQLIAGFSIPQGSYSVNVTLSGGTYYNSGTGLGYRSIALNGDCNSTGANHSSTNNYTLSLDLSTCATLNVVVSQYGYGD